MRGKDWLGTVDAFRTFLVNGPQPVYCFEAV